MDNVVITWLLNAVPDPQRDTHIGTDPMVLAELANSVTRHGYPLVVLTDCIRDGWLGGVRFIGVPPGGNPYWYRWELTASFLEANPQIRRAWACDGTDVEMLNDPFPHMQPDTLYSGSEPWPILGDAFSWLHDTGRSAVPWMTEHGDKTCLNVGLIGGDRHVVAGVTRALADAQKSGDKLEMGQYQRIAYEMYPDLVTGPLVHTRFRAEDRTAASWWRHK